MLQLSSCACSLVLLMICFGLHYNNIVKWNISAWGLFECYVNKYRASVSFSLYFRLSKHFFWPVVIFEVKALTLTHPTCQLNRNHSTSSYRINQWRAIYCFSSRSCCFNLLFLAIMLVKLLVMETVRTNVTVLTSFIPPYSWMQLKSTLVPQS